MEIIAKIEQKMSLNRVQMALIPSLVAFFATIQTAGAGQLLKIGTEESSIFHEAQVLSAPRPEIPSELHEQCFKSCCLARFIIQKDGKSSVKLLSSTGSPEVDDIAVTTLQQWKFKPATVNGQAVESAKKIRVEFEVEE